MSTSKHIDKICIVAVCLTLILAIMFMYGGTFGITPTVSAMEYESTLFDNSYVHSIDIAMEGWDSFIGTCENEEYGTCNLTVDGNKYNNVAIRAKGNTSLSNVKSLGSQRYSFKIEFDHYENGKSCDGLDKLCLNNLIQDNTMMKDYIVYQMMNDFGVDSPLCSFAYITVNGEDWGLYLAVEGIEDSFLSRNYGSDTGELYKPDSMGFGGGRGNGKDFKMDEFKFGDDETPPGDLPQMAKEKMPQGDMSQRFEGEAPPGDIPERPDSNATSKDFPQMTEGKGQHKDVPQGFDGDTKKADFPERPDGNTTPEGLPQIPEGDAPERPDSNTTSKDFPQMTEYKGRHKDVPQGFDGDTKKADFPQRPDGNTTLEGLPQIPEGDAPESRFSQIPQGGEKHDNIGKGGVPSDKGSDDVKLKYIDDDPDSYSNIFDNAKTDITAADKKRLITALKNLSKYADLENTVDIGEVLRYFVVHNFAVNGDSYTGNMIHNYYLHESDGRLGMIPWDYNLAFGTFHGNNASDAVNSSIDNPVSGGSIDDRPMIGWIFSDEKYTAQYHELFAEFIQRWFVDGRLTSMIEQTAKMLLPYIEQDPTKFCTSDEFAAGVKALSGFVTLRAEAVALQLNGDNTAVETGDLNLSDMGTMNMGTMKHSKERSYT